MKVTGNFRLYSTSIQEALKLANQMPTSNQRKVRKRSLRRTDFKLQSAEDFKTHDQPLKWPKLETAGQENPEQSYQMVKNRPIVKVKRNEWDVITYI